MGQELQQSRRSLFTELLEKYSHWISDILRTWITNWDWRNGGLRASEEAIENSSSHGYGIRLQYKDLELQETKLENVRRYQFLANDDDLGHYRNGWIFSIDLTVLVELNIRSRDWELIRY